MAQDSYSSLKQKIEKEIAKLQRQAKTLQNKQRRPVISTIVRSMRDYEITPDEISAAYHKTPTRAASPKVAGTTATRKVPVKYRHPDTGETWTGRGKAPRWITKAETEGRERGEFLVS